MLSCFCLVLGVPHYGRQVASLLGGGGCSVRVLSLRSSVIHGFVTEP